MAESVSDDNTHVCHGLTRGQEVMRNTNSRRGQTSITHLMNFTLPPRPDYRNANGLVRGTRRGNIYGIGSGHHSSDKARFIHANYRFIVKPDGNYRYADCCF